MAKLLSIAPDKDGYTVTPVNPTLSVALEGGPPRFRRGRKNGPGTVTVKWTVGPNEHDYLFAFNDLVQENPSEPFELELFMKNSDLQLFECYFLPSSPMTLQSHRGLTYVIAATLLVMPKEVNNADNESFIDVYNAFGPNFIEWLNRIHYDVNVQYPEFL